MIILTGYLFFFLNPVFAHQGDLLFLSETPLIQRKNHWPNWNKPLLSNKSNLKHDLVYPYWFKGLWEVSSIDLNTSEKLIIKHLARFVPDEKNRIVADRAFNSRSLGMAVMKDELFDVKDDPLNPNRQLSILNQGRLLETRIISREQEGDENTFFLSDELFLQILHSKNVPIIAKVEILSDYHKCSSEELRIHNVAEASICGEQLQVNYPFETDFNYIKYNHHHYMIFLKYLPSRV